MNPPRQLLFVYDGKMRGVGCDLDTEQMLVALSGAGWEVDFISRGRVERPGIRNHPARYSPAKLISFLPARFYYGANRRYLSRLAGRFLRRGRYDCVMAWSQSARFLFQEARSRGVPRVLHSGNLHVLGKGLDLKRTAWPTIDYQFMLDEFELADSVWVPSEFCRQSFVDQAYPPDRVHNLERGADLSRHFPAEQSPDKFRAICVGRVCERKGVHQLVEAWRRAGLKNAELWFVGAIDNEVREYVGSVKDASIKFWGFRQDTPDLVRQASVQVLLSRNEGLAKTLIEGSACGLPTVATREAGFPVREGETGFFVDREDPEAVATRLRELQAAPDRARAMGQAAREEALKRFTWDNFHRHFIQLLEGVVRDSGPGLVSGG